MELVYFESQSCNLFYLPDIGFTACVDMRESLGEPKPCSKSLNDIVLW